MYLRVYGKRGGGGRVTEIRQRTVEGPSVSGRLTAAARCVANTHTRVSLFAQTFGRHSVSPVPRLSFHAACTRHSGQRDDVADCIRAARGNTVTHARSAKQQNRRERRGASALLRRWPWLYQRERAGMPVVRWRRFPPDAMRDSTRSSSPRAFIG